MAIGTIGDYAYIGSKNLRVAGSGGGYGIRFRQVFGRWFSLLSILKADIICWVASPNTLT